MKTRLSFVSNSSSCSFMVCIPKREYKEFVDELKPHHKYALDCLDSTDDVVFGVRCVIHSGDIGYLYESMDAEYFAETYLNMDIKGLSWDNVVAKIKKEHDIDYDDNHNWFGEIKFPNNVFEFTMD